LAGRTQITTDNYISYRGKNGAIQNTFGRDGIDYGMLTKVYAISALPENRYAPPVCILAKKTPVLGQPDIDFICTSHVERQNLTIRLFNRRFTRLTLGFSKKLSNLRHSVALFNLLLELVLETHDHETDTGTSSGINRPCLDNR
jgi:hypothetical protein